MAVRADAEEEDVEDGVAELLGVGVGGRLDRRVLARRRERVHVLGREGELVEEGVARLGLVAVGVTAGEVPLVSPPDLDARPVDPVARGVRRDRAEHGDPHRAAGESDVDGLAFIEEVDDLRQEPRGDARRQARGVRVHEHPPGVGHTLDPSVRTTSPNSSSGSSRRSSSARQSRRLRRGDGCSRADTPRRPREVGERVEDVRGVDVPEAERAHAGGVDDPAARRHAQRDGRRRRVAPATGDLVDVPDGPVGAGHEAFTRSTCRRRSVRRRRSCDRRGGARARRSATRPAPTGRRGCRAR